MPKPTKQRQAKQLAKTPSGLLSISWQIWLGVALIAGFAIVAYWPSLSGGFILDDDLLLTDSPLIKAPAGIFQFWYTTDQPDYVPLTSSTLWLEWRFWRLNSDRLSRHEPGPAHCRVLVNLAAFAPA